MLKKTKEIDKKIQNKIYKCTKNRIKLTNAPGFF